MAFDLADAVYISGLLVSRTSFLLFDFVWKEASRVRNQAQVANLAFLWSWRTLWWIKSQGFWRVTTLSRLSVWPVIVHLVLYKAALHDQVRAQKLLPHKVVLGVLAAQTIMVAVMAYIHVPHTASPGQLLLVVISTIIAPYISSTRMRKLAAPGKAASTFAASASYTSDSKWNKHHDKAQQEDASTQAAHRLQPAPIMADQTSPRVASSRPSSWNASSFVHSNDGMRLLDTAGSMAAVHARSALIYRSRLGRHAMITMKIDKVQPEDMPSDLMKKIGAALTRESVTPGLQLASGAIRRGCVLITLHTLRLNPSAQLADAELCQHAAAILLPVLRGLFNECVAGGLPSGEHVRIQCADALISCFYTGRGAVEGWELHVENQGQLKRMAFSGVKLGVIMAPLAAKEAAGSGWGMEDDGAAEPGAMQLQLQVWGLGCGLELDGWAPVPAGQHMPVSPPRRSGPPTAGDDEYGAYDRHPLQVLARCEGRYLPTRTKTLGSQGTLTMVSVTVSPSSGPAASAAHSPGAEGLLLQPVTLELWHGDQLIDVAYALAMPAPPSNMLPGAKPAATSHSWNARAAVSGAAAAELQTLAGQLWLEFDRLDANVLTGHKAYMHDLCVWLEEVRRCAQASRQRAASGAASLGGLAPTLTHARRQALTADLAMYAERVGLGSLAAWITQQNANSADPRDTSNGKSWLAGKITAPGHDGSAAATACAHGTAAGYDCSMCDAGLMAVCQKVGRQWWWILVQLVSIVLGRVMLGGWLRAWGMWAGRPAERGEHGRRAEQGHLATRKGTSPHAKRE